MDNITGFHVTHGYCRCSTDESKQDINRQIRELKKYGATRIWTEFEHGDTAVKEQQQTMLQVAQPGDTVVVLEVSRLARSTRQLCEIMETIRDRHLCLRIVGSITMDCRAGTPDPMAEAFLQIAGVFSQLELAMIRSRVKSGMANARARGVRLGRPPICADGVPERFLRYYPRYSRGDVNVSELARLTGFSRPTVYRYLKALEEG